MKVKRSKRDQVAWEQMFKVLRIYVRTNGHCRVPPNPEPSSLGYWLAQQLKVQRGSNLPEKQFRQLEKLGVDFGESDNQTSRDWQERWEERLKELADFQRRHGHCQVSRRSAEHHGLAVWLQNQRTRQNQGRLPPECWGQLQKLGVQLGRTSLNWDKSFSELAAYQKKHGHCDVPCHSKIDRKLGHWVGNQRGFRRKGLLSQERIAKLDELGFRWVAVFDRNTPSKSFEPWIKAREAQWQFMFERLVAYKKKHGHCSVTPTDGFGGRLNKWVILQRIEAREGTLLPTRQQRLDDIGFIWKGDNHDRRWRQQYDKLVAYQKKHGHCDVPCHWSKDRRLGHWISIQRIFRRKGSLNPERIQLLDQIGFRWNALFNLKSPPKSFRKLVSAQDALWNQMFARLLLYKKSHGHCGVLQADGCEGRLHKWVIRQRMNAKAGILPIARKQQLDQAGFLWEGRANDDRWDKQFAKLMVFQKTNGHCDVPCHLAEDRPFGHWIANQRSFYHKGQINPERIQRLEAIGFRWVVGQRRNI